MYRNITRCRACGSSDLESVFDLGLQPPANDFKKIDEPRAGYAPLKVVYCHRCTLAQLSVVVDPEILYSRYSYVTSRSQTMASHFASLCKDIKQENGGGSVLEIGSNDGHFLSACVADGFGPVIGVDPALNLCSKAADNKLQIVCGMWNQITAQRVTEQMAKVDNVIARHVFCHIDDWQEFIAALDMVAHEKTLVCIEVPYLVDMLSRLELDTIYHEHLSYFTVRSMMALLQKTNWHLHRITPYSVHGGLIVVMLRRNDCRVSADRSVVKYLSEEINFKTGIDAWKKFQTEACRKMETLSGTISRCIANGSSVCGFGASAKSTVWINACRLNGMLSFITDTTEEKIGRVSPGTNIPIVAEDVLKEKPPKYLVMFCWNYRDEVLKNMKPFLDGGGQFIIPFPDVEIVGR